ncbi:hypothetical protein KEM55_002247, partial [Ascosphaera atra]
LPYNHAHYLNFLVPNAAMYSAISTPGPATQNLESTPAVPLYAGAVYPPFIPGTIPGFAWPCPVNGAASDTNGTKPAPWSTGENQAPFPGVEQSIQSECHPAVPAVEQHTYMHYTYHTNPHMQQQQCLPLQMMKSGNGYVIQDLDALLKQDPPIPRAVPAMWTNPNELSLARCLENREGITNVYIRGFAPETTDGMLHAYAARFGNIDRCKAIVDLDTGKCKGSASAQT